MQSTHFRHTILTGIAALALILVAAPSVSAEEVAPAAQLSVTLTSSAETVTAGDVIAYTGEVKNLGAAEAVVTVVVESPAFLTLGAAEGATIEGNKASWPVTLAPGAAQSVEIDATVGEIPETEKRVTTLASVYVGDDASPIVRTASASFIAGVDDSPAKESDKGSTDTSDAGDSGDSSALPWIIAAVVAVLLAAAVVACIVFLRRKNRSNRSARSARSARRARSTHV
jgi:hypothetical protein